MIYQFPETSEAFLMLLLIKKYPLTTAGELRK